MFNLNQKVTCENAQGQPRLQEGKEYTVWATECARGIRVESETERIPHLYNLDRFEPVQVVPAAEEVKWVLAVLILNGVVYEVKVNPDEDDQCTRIRDMCLMSADY